MITLQQVTLQRGQRLLLNAADLMIHQGQKMAIVGPNGCGKSSLFLLFQGELSADKGELMLPKQLRMAHIRQEIPSGQQSALDYATEGDSEYAKLQRELTAAEAKDDGIAMAEIYSALAEIDGFAIPSKAAKILLGLGFSQAELQQPIDSFSGGWRMRLNLAQVLLARADLLLLDEPTNHLDLDAIIWLESYLQSTSQTILFISHDREFLDNVSSHTVHCREQKLVLYPGNYSQFEKQYAEQLAIQQATYEKQEKQRAHLQSFVDRFRYKASKAKQAQSRVKMLEKIQWVEAVHASSQFHFDFKQAEPAGSPMLQLSQVNFAYDEEPILQDVNFSLRDGDRIGLIGPNGAGKSTLIKLLCDNLSINQGERIASKKLNIGYFAQHQLEALRADETPLWHVQQLSNTISEREARQYLGRFNFSNDDVFRPVASFSGGEKSRLCLALLIWQAPNLILLDEPTNHLDMEMREALNLALQQYDGVMVLVSHDRFLLKSVCEDLWLVANQTVSRFAGDVDDYRQWLTDYLQQEQAEANVVKAKPDKIRPVDHSQKIERLEQQLLAQQTTLANLDQQLTDNCLYQTENVQQLQQLQTEREAVVIHMAELEDAILQLLADE